MSDQTRDVEWAIHEISKYAPCPHDTLESGNIWARCDDCGQTVPCYRLDKHRDGNNRFNDAIDIIQKAVNDASATPRVYPFHAMSKITVDNYGIREELDMDYSYPDTGGRYVVSMEGSLKEYPLDEPFKLEGKGLTFCVFTKDSNGKLFRIGFWRPTSPVDLSRGAGPRDTPMYWAVKYAVDGKFDN